MKRQENTIDNQKKEPKITEVEHKIIQSIRGGTQTKQ